MTALLESLRTRNLENLSCLLFIYYYLTNPEGHFTSCVNKMFYCFVGENMKCKMKDQRMAATNKRLLIIQHT